jgi:hypothetical protein
MAFEAKRLSVLVVTLALLHEEMGTQAEVAIPGPRLLVERTERSQAEVAIPDPHLGVRIVETAAPLLGVEEVLLKEVEVAAGIDEAAVAAGIDEVAAGVMKTEGVGGKGDRFEPIC